MVTDTFDPSRHRQSDICEFEASLACPASDRTARTTGLQDYRGGESCLKKQKQNKQNKEELMRFLPNTHLKLQGILTHCYLGPQEAQN